MQRPPRTAPPRTAPHRPACPPAASRRYPLGTITVAELPATNFVFLLISKTFSPRNFFRHESNTLLKKKRNTLAVFSVQQFCNATRAETSDQKRQVPLIHVEFHLHVQ